jgi:hypothetical protein
MTSMKKGLSKLEQGMKFFKDNKDVMEKILGSKLVSGVLVCLGPIGIGVSVGL